MRDGEYPLPHTSADLIRETGITYRQLDYWTHVGYLTPVGDSHPGTGATRLYATAQVQLASTMRLLIEAGFSAAAANTIATQLAADGEAQLGPFTIITTGRRP